MIEDIIIAVMLWFVISFLINFANNYKEIAEERQESTEIKYVFLQIEVERIKDMWYGWVLNDGEYSFVAQGNTYAEAVANCKDRIEEKNPDYKIVFKFKMKYDEQPALQS